MSHKRASFLWESGFIWSDAFLWDTSFIWSDAFLWDTSFIWSDSLSETVSINQWVAQE